MRIWIIDWIGFCLEFYGMELALFILVFICHSYYWRSNFGPVNIERWALGISLPIFVGFCAWIVYCSYKQGYAVG